MPDADYTDAQAALDLLAKVKPGPTPASQQALKDGKAKIRAVRERHQPPPPEEEPEPPPPPAGTVIFRDTFASIPAAHKSNGTWYNQANPERSSAGPNGYVAEIRGGDIETDTGLEMSELSMNHEASLGEEFWISHWLRWTSLASPAPSWETIHEWHDGDGEGRKGGEFSPPVALFNQGGKLLLKNGRGSPTYWSGPAIVEGTWINLLYRLRFGKTDGEVELWWGGEKAASWSGLTSNTGKNYLKIGEYRSKKVTQATSRTEHRELVFATTMDAALHPAPAMKAALLEVDDLVLPPEHWHDAGPHTERYAYPAELPV